MKNILLPMLLVALTGCVAPPTHTELTNADYGPEPHDYQAPIKSYMNVVLKDPDSARYNFYRATVKAYAGNPRVYGWGTCFHVNAKNSFGGYTGMQQYFVIIRYGSVAQVISGDGKGGIMDGIVTQSCANLGPAPQSAPPSSESRATSAT